MAAKTRARKRAILFLSDIVGTVTPADLGHLLELKGETERIGLQNMLARMVRTYFMADLGCGGYHSTGKHRLHGVDAFAYVEDRIRDYLMTSGGAAPTMAIYQSVFNARRDWKCRDYTHPFMHKVLRESHWFRQRATGVWELAPGMEDPWQAALSAL
jgi:hypothetical protein